MSQERAPWSRGWKGTAVKLVIAAALLILARLSPIAGTIGLLVFLATVVKPAATTPSRR